MKKLFHKVALILALSSIVPLVAYGIYAVNKSYSVSHAQAKMRNQRIALEISKNITDYLEDTERVISSLAEVLNRRYLTDWQKEEILQNYRMNFKEFDSLNLYLLKGEKLISSDPGKKKLDEREKIAADGATNGKIYLSDFFMTQNLMPSLMLAYPLEMSREISSVLVCRLNMLSIWKMVDDLKIGKTGYPMIVSTDGLIYAYGNPSGKELIINKVNFSNGKFLNSVASSGFYADTIENPLGVKVLAAGKLIKQSGWIVVVEQSAKEALSDSRNLLVNLSIFAVLFLMLSALVGLFGSRRLVKPINELKKGAMEVAKGNLDYRLNIKGRDEIKDLSLSFNRMAEDLIRYKEEILKKERLATFARLASGLVHDLKHPVQNIRNAYNLIETNPKNEKYVETFKSIMSRELEVMQRFFKDLRDVAHPPPMTIIDLDVHKELANLIESLKPGSLEKGIILDNKFDDQEIVIKVDKFVFDRIINNIISNSLKALGDGALGDGERIEVITDRDQEALIEIKDNGPGIPKSKLKSVFDEFTSLKGGGLGLGLAVVKKMVIEMGGSIVMESEEGKGTSTKLRFPLVFK